MEEESFDFGSKEGFAHVFEEGFEVVFEEIEDKEDAIALKLAHRPVI